MVKKSNLQNHHQPNSCMIILVFVKASSQNSLAAVYTGMKSFQKYKMLLSISFIEDKIRNAVCQKLVLALG